MTLDPRTPVLVGVGQVTTRPSAGARFADAPTPLDLMTEALELASADAHATTSLLAQLDELIAIGSFTWHPRDPAALVAERLALRPHATSLTPTGGNLPQKIVHATARRVASGDVACVAVVGSEAMHAHALARREGVALDWPTQSDDVPRPTMVEEERIPFTAEEYEQGLHLPVDVYPLFENARRFARGWNVSEHRERLGRLWQHFARVAAENPYAWLRDAPDAATITTPSAANRMVAFPYTKLLVANLPVDMGAAFIMTSYEFARAHGVPQDRMIFPQAGAEANDHWFVSERPRLDDSPAMRAIWDALRSNGAHADDFAHVDLYSCFPTVVQCASDVLGLDPLDPSRVPTVTGGLTFFGGPGNNYVTHSIASMVERLREDPTSQGLVSALGWFSTKHAWGTYAATPPPQGFFWRSVQDVVDRQPTCVTVTTNASVTVESYTVTHGRDGAPKRLIVAGRLDDERRLWGHSEDATLMATAETDELIGRRGDVRDGTFTL
ncbi:MAG: acetyl-CoA acetyltransferase [Acidobacteriota bacterium]|nr:acetyl-CoA acetyltransferase [Acidobacteriota bacterium]